MIKNFDNKCMGCVLRKIVMLIDEDFIDNSNEIKKILFIFNNREIILNDDNVLKPEAISKINKDAVIKANNEMKNLELVFFNGLDKDEFLSELQKLDFVWNIIHKREIIEISKQLYLMGSDRLLPAGYRRAFN